MEPMTVACLLYIFLHNWNRSHSLEEEEVSGMFQQSVRDLQRCAPQRTIVLQKKLKGILEDDTRKRKKNHFCRQDDINDFQCACQDEGQE